jgi:transketolase
MLENTELRAVYCEEMLKLAEKDDKIMIVEADLMRAAGMIPFRDKYPERALDVGVAEANMVGIAAGLAVMGKKPFVHSFTPFATRRCFDQITISVAYAKNNVKIIGSDPGLSAEINGGTHMSFDDVNMMRGIPDMVIIEPVDRASMQSLLPQFAALDKAAYLRLYRKKAYKVYEDGVKLTIGKAYTVKDGNDIAIIASGIMVSEAVAAAEELAKSGVNARVIDMHTIKPFDKDVVIKAAKECGAIVTAENHSIIGGLATSVAEVLCDEGIAVPFKKVGIKDRFGVVGFRHYLQEELEVTSNDVLKAANTALQMKK